MKVNIYSETILLIAKQLKTLFAARIKRLWGVFAVPLSFRSHLQTFDSQTFNPFKSFRISETISFRLPETIETTYLIDNQIVKKTGGTIAKRSKVGKNGLYEAYNMILEKTNKKNRFAPCKRIYS